MGKPHSAISDALRAFIEAQSVFFVATAPLSGDGHVNLSPKGLDTFRVLSPQRVMYLDLTGSGNETAAHLVENGRITIMMCAFAGPPKILRLYGTGRVVLPQDADWPELRAQFGDYAGVRQIIVVEVEQVRTSCGFGVPLMGEPQPRDTLIRWAEGKGAEGLKQYRRTKNAHSIDGLIAPLAAGDATTGR
jgi:hypothetical protein